MQREESVWQHSHVSGVGVGSEPQVLQGDKNTKVKGWVWGQTGVRATAPPFADRVTFFFALLLLVGQTGMAPS